MAGDEDLIGQAAKGDASARLGLIHACIDAGASGTVSSLEALVAAEVWARLAAGSGGADAHQALAGVLMARSDFEVARGNVRDAQFFEATAQSMLGRSAAEGNACAREVLAEIPTCDLPDADDGAAALVDQHYAAAAHGDLTACSALIDAVMSGQSEALAKLVVAENLARYGAAADDQAMSGKLSGILYLRAQFELDLGNEPRGLNCLLECVAVLLGLAAGGDKSVQPHLADIAERLDGASLAFMTGALPDLLIYRSPQGAA